MSSFFGHAATGLAIGLICRERCGLPARIAVPVCVLLAICADFDYFAIWLLDARVAPRITHTLAFCFGVAVLALGCFRFTRLRSMYLRSMSRTASAPVLAFTFAAAALSHPLLDLAVGAHGLPLLWPLPLPEVVSPLGVLPSAGRIAFGNVYFWRNLLIEAGVLLPLLALAVALATPRPRSGLLRRMLLVAPVWLGFLYWSTGLSR